MATNRTFQDMLNEYLTYDLLKEEMVKKSYLLNKIEKDDGWKGGNLVVPFKAAGASSLKFGGLVDSNDIAQDKFVRGNVSYYKELWGSMIFNHKDFIEHDGKVNEKSFLKILPGVVEDFTDYMRDATSIVLLNGAHLAKAVGNGDASGNITHDRPDRLQIGQKLTIDDDNSSPVDGYVLSINMNTLVVNFVTTRGGATPVDLSAYTTAQNAKVYIPGAQSGAFTSLRESLLSSANGGGATLYGQTKTNYPYLQAINIDGTSWDGTNLLTKLFDGYTDTRRYGKGNPNTLLMSWKNLATVMKLVEASKGAYKTSATTEKASLFGWTEIEIVGVKGRLTVVGIQEIDDDVIMYIDWRALKLHSNGMFRKRMSPEGKEYYEIRGSDGFQYILDMFFFGDLILNRPSYCGIAHTIDYT